MKITRIREAAAPIAPKIRSPETRGIGVELNPKMFAGMRRCLELA